MNNPHAMTAQAGAVGEVIRNTAGQVYIHWRDGKNIGHFIGATFYTDPPAAVPVEALEGLVAALRNEAATIAKPYGFVTNHILGKAEGLESCAERIERLIKERSNG